MSHPRSRPSSTSLFGHAHHQVTTRIRRRRGKGTRTTRTRVAAAAQVASYVSSHPSLLHTPDTISHRVSCFPHRVSSTAVLTIGPLITVPHPCFVLHVSLTYHTDVYSPSRHSCPTPCTITRLAAECSRNRGSNQHEISQVFSAHPSLPGPPGHGLPLQGPMSGRRGLRASY